MAMAVYKPSAGEAGKYALNLRVSALREMNGAEPGPIYRRYNRAGSEPVYEVETVNKVVRELGAKDVAPYIIGQHDRYEGVRHALPQALYAALSDPTVDDHEGLVAAVMDYMDKTIGKPLAAASGRFLGANELAAETSADAGVA